MENFTPLDPLPKTKSLQAKKYSLRRENPNDYTNDEKKFYAIDQKLKDYVDALIPIGEVGRIRDNKLFNYEAIDRIRKRVLQKTGMNVSLDNILYNLDAEDRSMPWESTETKLDSVADHLAANMNNEVSRREIDKNYNAAVLFMTGEFGIKREDRNGIKVKLKKLNSEMNYNY